MNIKLPRRNFSSGTVQGTEALRTSDLATRHAALAGDPGSDGQRLRSIVATARCAISFGRVLNHDSNSNNHRADSRTC